MVCVNKIKLCHLVKNKGSKVTTYLYHLVELDPNDLNTTITPWLPPAGVLSLVPALLSDLWMLYFYDI